MTERQTPPARALICLRYGIGDVVMELPALRHLRAQWPDTHLTALGAHPATQLLEGDPVVDAVAQVQDLGFAHWGDPGTIEARRTAAGWIAANRFERVLDSSHAVTGMRRVLTGSGLPAFNTGESVEPAIAGEDSEPRGSATRSILHGAAHAWGLAEAPPNATPRLHIGHEAHHAARALLHERGLTGQERVGIAPVASSRLKRWPLARVAELIGRLVAARACRILVFGTGPDDEAAPLLRAATAPGTIELIPPMHLQRTAALIARCHALVGNDTGLMHIGAAVGTGTVALFGPTSPAVVLPAGATAVAADRPCPWRHADRLGPPRCILEDRCLIGGRSCIDRIGVDAVEARVRAVLDAGPDAGHDIGHPTDGAATGEGHERGHERGYA